MGKYFILEAPVSILDPPPSSGYERTHWRLRALEGKVVPVLQVRTQGRGLSDFLSNVQSFCGQRRD